MTTSPVPRFIQSIRRAIVAFFVLGGISLWAISCKQSAPNSSNLTPPPPPPGIATFDFGPVTPVVVKGDPTKFTHASHEKRPDGSELSCDSCHFRKDNSDKPTFPGHSSCISCHLSEFTATNVGTQGMCIICHQNVNTVDAPQKQFPDRKSYNAFFDPKQHQEHVEYSFPDSPAQKVSCEFCHPTEEKGVAIRFPAHLECYACHIGNEQPGANTKSAPSQSGNNFSASSVPPGAAAPGNCAVCHLKPTAPVQPLLTKMTAGSYAYKFTHRDHKQVAKCQECHNLNGTYNTNQVSVPKAKEHLINKTPAGQGCFSCHNDLRAFGDKDFTNCTRCHTQGQLGNNRASS